MITTTGPAVAAKAQELEKSERYRPIRDSLRRSRGLDSGKVAAGNGRPYRLSEQLREFLSNFGSVVVEEQAA